MEELSTHWSLSLTWQTFVCCILARSTTELLHSITTTIEHHEGIFELSESALFDVMLKISCNPELHLYALIFMKQTKTTLKLTVLIFIPAVIIGIMGGFLGSLYIFMHLKMAKIRRRILKKIKGPRNTNIFKLLEVVILCVSVSYYQSFHILLRLLLSFSFFGHPHLCCPCPCFTAIA